MLQKSAVERAYLYLPDGKDHADLEKDWYGKRIAGLPHVIRTLFSLQQLAIRRVDILCGKPMRESVERTLAPWRDDPRMPHTSVAVYGDTRQEGGAELALFLDGAVAFDPGLASHLISRNQRSALMNQDHRPVGMGLMADSDPPEPDTLRTLPAAAAPSDLFILPARNPKERRAAEKSIRRSLKQDTDGWIARHLNRPVSLLVSGGLLRFPVHPHLITFVNFLVGAAAGILAASGNFPSLATAGVLFQLASILDGVDGEVARAKFLSSRSGQWLDTLCDEATNLMFLIGIVVGMPKTSFPRGFFWLGIAAVGMYFFTLALLYGHLIFKLRSASLLAFQETIQKPGFKQNRWAPLILFLQPLIKRDMYAFVFMWLALFNLPWLIISFWLLAMIVTPVIFLSQVLKTL